MMRTRLHIAGLLVAALLLGACGSIDNDPFRRGTVRGQVEGANPALALVSVQGEPGLRSGVDAQGNFELTQVPVGEVELFIVADAARAARVRVMVNGAQAVTVEKVKPKDAGFLDVRVRIKAEDPVDAPQAPLTGALVTVEGTPFQRLALDTDGRTWVGPLPDGCWQLTVSAPGYLTRRQEGCVGVGERKPVIVRLGGSGDQGLVNGGCRVTGCALGAVCAGDGRCVECETDGHCAAGFACRANRCEGAGPVCAPCAGDWQCAAGSRCQEVAEGGRVCVAGCGEGGACAAGFVCEAGSCQPDPARLQGCFAFNALGSTCAVDTGCQARGLEGGVCAEGRCTLRCDGAGAVCPVGWACGGGVCERAQP